MATDGFLKTGMRATKNLAQDVASNLREQLTVCFGDAACRLLPNGLFVTRGKSRKSNLLEAEVIINSGSADDPVNLQGMAHLIEHMMFRSISPACRNLLDEFEARGGTYINAATSSVDTEYRFTIPAGTGNERLMHKVISEFIYKPEFLEEGLQREKEIVLNEIAMYNNQNETKIQRALISTAVGMPSTDSLTLGTEQSLYSIQLADLKKFHKDHYTARNTRIDIKHTGTMADLFTNIRSAYANLPSIPRTAKNPPQAPYIGGNHHIENESTQTTVAVGFKAPRFESHDRIMRHVLTNYIKSVMFDVTRLERNLVYCCNAEYPLQSVPTKDDLFVLSAAARPERAGEILPIFAKIMKDLYGDEIDDHKLNHAIAVTARDLNLPLKREPEGYAKILRDAAEFAGLNSGIIPGLKATIYIDSAEFGTMLHDHMLAYPPTLVTSGNVENVQSYEVFRDMLPKRPEEHRLAIESHEARKAAGKNPENHPPSSGMPG